MNCTPNVIAQKAACFNGMDKRLWKGIVIYLLCKWATALAYLTDEKGNYILDEHGNKIVLTL